MLCTLRLSPLDGGHRSCIVLYPNTPVASALLRSSTSVIELRGGVGPFSPLVIGEVSPMPTVPQLVAQAEPHGVYRKTKTRELEPPPNKIGRKGPCVLRSWAKKTCEEVSWRPPRLIRIILVPKALVSRSPLTCRPWASLCGTPPEPRVRCCSV